VEAFDQKEPQAPKPIDGIYFDRHGLIVQADGDGGDTAQREGMYWFARAMRERGEELSRRRLPPFQAWRTKAEYMRVMNLLEFKNIGGEGIGLFVRHPYQREHNDPRKMSRDQLLPLIAAMSAWDDQARLTRVYERLSGQPGPFAFLNKDWMDLFRQYIRRARNQAPDETIDKVVLDGATIARLCCIEDANDVGDDLNLGVILGLPEMPRQRKDYIRSIRRKFVEKRPMNYGIYLTQYYRHYAPDVGLPLSIQQERIENGIRAGWTPDVSNAFGAIKWYCRWEAQGSPGLATLLKPIYDQYFYAPSPPRGATFRRYDEEREKCELVKGFCQRN
jgi:hypothetical protein